MNSYENIINNKEGRYALYKAPDSVDYSIVDIFRGAIVLIDDPIINKEKLIEALIEKGFQIFSDFKKMPEPTEKPLSSLFTPDKYPIFVKKLYDKLGKETGSIVTAMPNAHISTRRKKIIESALQNYAFDVLYPNEGLNFYSNTEDDTASLLIIRGINEMPSEMNDIVIWEQ